MPARRPPLVITGLPRSGTSWVGKMLEYSNEVVYVNEPMNPLKPPGRSPGVLDANVEHYFHYICPDNESLWLAAFGRARDLQFGLVREVQRNHSPYELARAAKYQAAFALGRRRGRRAMFDDPYAMSSAAWLADRFDMRVVVLVRDPVEIATSWARMGWQVSLNELLDQPLLVRDHLGPDLAALRAAVHAGDQVESVAWLWRALYTVALRQVSDSRIVLRRYENLARDPVAGFRELYATCGLSWTEEVQAQVEAATTAGSGHREQAFRWSLRSGMSRTAFRPMDSQAMAAPRRADPEVERTVRAITEDVEADLAKYVSSAT